MSKLFLFSLLEIFSQIPLDLIVIVINSLIVIVAIFYAVLTLIKRDKNIKNRLWFVFFMVGICFVQLWIELSITGKVIHLFLTIGISICTLPLILFLPRKKLKITQPQRNLARLINNSVKAEKTEYHENNLSNQSEVFSSPIIKAEPRIVNDNDEKQTRSEIDFSHVKSVLDKLGYYPLKEQDKRQAKELQNAILVAEQNGMTKELKEKINDGLGALLKIMSKYAI